MKLIQCDAFIPPSWYDFNSDHMEEEEMEEVSLDEKAGKEKVKEVVEKKEDQVLAALGNIGRWQVQIIMITGYISAPTGVLKVKPCATI